MKRNLLKRNKNEKKIYPFLGSIIMAIIIKTALLASLCIILLTHSTTPMVKRIDVFAEADDSIDADAPHVYISDDNSDNNDGGWRRCG